MFKYTLYYFSDGLREQTRSGRPFLDKLQSLSKSPMSNMVYSSSSSSKPWSSWSSSRDITYSPDASNEYNNNYYELIDNYRSTPDGVNTTDRGSSCGNYATLPSRLRKSGKRSPEDHIYEVIPHQTANEHNHQVPQQPLHQQQNMSVDEDNYWVPNTRLHVEEARNRWNSAHKTATQSNLRTMKCITRSVDSIRGAHHPKNKLRSQATVSNSV